MRNNYENFAGTKINRLTAIKYVCKNKYGEQLWLFKCDCGNEKIMKIYNVKIGNSKSCGCLTNEKIASVKRLPDGIAARNHSYRNYKKGAERRNYDFDLSLEDFIKISLENCFYCGEMPNRIYYAESVNTGKWVANGIDRLDNKIGYNIDNCVACCWTCNDMKKNKNNIDFLAHIKKIYLYNA